VLPTPTDAVGLSRAELLRAPTLVGASGVGALGLLHLRDPHESGSYGFCPFLMVTGHPCPGCGGLRAMNDLTHGDVIGALSSNAMAVVLLAVMAVAGIVWFYRRWRGQPVPLLAAKSPVLWGLLAAFAVFGVFRWTPWGVWFLP
jgi:hypothetical protein